jgi:hypothetical protein
VLGGRRHAASLPFATPAAAAQVVQSKDYGKKGVLMESSSPAQVLVVANRTAATPALLDAIRARAARGPASFHLLVPDPHECVWSATDGERRQKASESTQALEQALPVLEAAAGGPVDGSVSTRHDPMDAIEETLRGAQFDEIILSTLPHSISRWLHIDLPHRVAHLGLPVTTVTADEQQAAGVA